MDETAVCPDARFTFDTFVPGQNSMPAVSAARAVSEAPGKGFNPLYLWGGAGMGKTHLLNAIVSGLSERHPRANVRLYSYEQFTDSLIDAIVCKTTDGFYSYLKSLDALLIDDLQFLTGRSSTQQEFGFIFKDLLDAGVQLVFSADRSPERTTADEGLLHLINSGAVIMLGTPDPENRREIILKKAALLDCKLEPDALDLIALSGDRSISKLEGTLKSCDFIARATGKGAITPAIVTDYLCTYASTPVPTADELIEITARYMGVTRAEILSKSRDKAVAAARCMVINLLNRQQDWSIRRIGELFGRDHSVILHSIIRSEQLAKEDPSYAATLKKVCLETGLRSF